MKPDSELMKDLVAAMKRGLAECRKQLAAAKGDYSMCEIAVQMLPMWEFIEKYHETDPALVLTYVHSMASQSKT